MPEMKQIFSRGMPSFGSTFCTCMRMPWSPQPGHHLTSWPDWKSFRVNGCGWASCGRSPRALASGASWDSLPGNSLDLLAQFAHAERPALDLRTAAGRRPGTSPAGACKAGPCCSPARGSAGTASSTAPRLAGKGFKCRRCKWSTERPACCRPLDRRRHRAEVLPQPTTSSSALPGPSPPAGGMSWAIRSIFSARRPTIR